VLSARAAARLRERGTVPLWVYFTDKGERGPALFARMVEEAGRGITERARTRRARETGGSFVPDYYDVPVARAYVEAVVSSGARVRQVSRWLNAVSVEADESTARRLAALPFVRFVAPVARSRRIAPVDQGRPWSPARGPSSSPGLERAPLFRGPGGLAAELGPATGYGTSQTQLLGINAIAAQDSGFTGAGVVVAMLDTGFNKGHSATVQLARLGEWDFVFHDGETANQGGDEVTAWDHGTGTWSVLGGYWDGNLIGPAYNASFLLAKTEDVRSETPIEEDNWVAAAEWADSLGADVISSSLAYLDFDPVNIFNPGDYTYTDLDGATTVVTLGALYAKRHGIVVANAMGNQGDPSCTPGSLWAPADADSILSVGAVDAANLRASFSSTGPTYDGRTKPEVVAQGVGTAWAAASNNNLVSTASGTSLSTPLVGGAAALVREAHPEWTVDQIRQALMLTADKASTPDNCYGWGRINVVKAIYGSPYGGPVYPKPFSLLAPTNGASISSMPITFRWRRAIDLNPGDLVTYRLDLCTSAPEACVLSFTTTDTSFTVSQPLGPNSFVWSVTATDNASHGRRSRERFLFTTSGATGVAVGGTPPPAPAVMLYQNRPNPLLRATEIDFSLHAGNAGGLVPVTFRIYDAQGRLVRTLLDAVPHGTSMSRCTVRWDGLDDGGRRAGSGIYHYQLAVGGKVYSKRMLVLR
jgi:subtilisin family serine protease